MTTWTAGLLNLLLPALGSSEETAPTPGPMASLIVSLPAPRSQEWFGAPVLPSVFRGGEPPGEPPLLDGSRPQDGRLPPPPSSPAPAPAREPPSEERPWGQGLTAEDLRAWRQADDLRVLHQWAGDALLGLPLLVPQLVIESFLPRGIQVGPTTYLYRTSPGSSGLAVIVLDQMMFHEAELMIRVREMEEDRWVPGDLTGAQPHVLRRSVMTGVRATYGMPGLSMSLALQTASDMGTAGLLLAPPAVAGLLYLKGLDQRFEIDDGLSVRVKASAPRHWADAVDSKCCLQVLSFDIRLPGLPVGLLGGLELSTRGMGASFVGLGTSLGAVEEVLGREAHATRRE
jgi:hypothetical protein